MNESIPSTSPEAGFTMVEIIVALMILTVGVLGLAGTTAFVVSQVTAANIATQRTTAQQTVMEELRAIHPDDLPGSGNDTVGRYAISWTTSTTPRGATVTMISTGPGLQRTAGSLSRLTPSVTDTTDFRVINR